MDDLIAQSDTKEEMILDLIKHWKLLKFKINELEDDKKSTEDLLKELLNHPAIDGSKTYKHDNHSIRITTGLNHTLDKKAYEKVKSLLNPKFNPVNEVIKYELNKKTLRDCFEFGTPEENYLQSQFIVSKPKKLHISIEDLSDEKNVNTVSISDDSF